MNFKPALHLLCLKNYSIYEQLQLEEALLRSTEKNWCIFNHGSPQSIVMGISGKPGELIDVNKVQKEPLPVIKRYSGGGTVIVDSNTLFVSFIFQKEDHDFPCYPEPILRWSEAFYKESLAIPGFHLRENDYVIGEKKCGGNAQYIKKNRFVHHTTFLWDFAQENMEYLLHPPKAPKYRQDRPHHEFLCKLKDHFSSPEDFFASLEMTLQNRYHLESTSPEKLISFLASDHRKATTHIEIERALL